jgi:hypothetical protein
MSNKQVVEVNSGSGKDGKSERQEVEKEAIGNEQLARGKKQQIMIIVLQKHVLLIVNCPLLIVNCSYGSLRKTVSFNICSSNKKANAANRKGMYCSLNLL